MPAGKKSFESVKQILPENYITWLLLSLSAIVYLFIGYGLSRPQFLIYLSGYLLVFAAYVHLLKRNVNVTYHQPDRNTAEVLSAETTGLLLNRKSDLPLLIAAGIFFRLLFLFSIPVLSDDYFRFAWDGTMLTSGENPYTILPAEYMKDCDKHMYYLIDLFNAMNSPNYYTVYPPVCQYLFGLSAQLFPENLLGSVVVLRLCCIAAETGTILLLIKILERLNLPKRNVLLYALNPLVIIELSGNLHQEAVMIFFVVLSIHLLLNIKKHLKTDEEPVSWLTAKSTSGISKEKSHKPGLQDEYGISKMLVLSAVSFAAAVATKLIPFMFLPFLIRRLQWKTSLIYFAIIALVFLLLFAPFLNPQLLTQWGSSIQLYFQHFEFNGSVYYLTRWIGFHTVDQNIVQKAGTGLAAVTFISILFLAIREKDTSWMHLFTAMQWSLTIYLLLATTVHPWYITTLVMCSAITGKKYPIVWTLFIALSYATYQTIPYRENLWLVAVEYAAVLVIIFFEIKPQLRKKNLY